MSRPIEERVERLEVGFAKVLDAPTPDQLAADVADQGATLELLFQISGLLTLAMLLIAGVVFGVFLRGVLK